MKQWIKEHLRQLFGTSFVICIPAMVGFAMWDRLPETMTTHWGADGVADGSMGKLWAILALPLILLIAHWGLALVTAAIPQNRNQSKRATEVVFWMMPLVAWFISGLMYATAMGGEFSFQVCIPVLAGLMFLLLGNFMPKFAQNPTMGIKLPWTLGNKDNWNKTHRLCGRIWFFGGVLMLFTGFLPGSLWVWAMVGLMVLMVAVPIGYSYCLYRKDKKAGAVYDWKAQTKAEKIACRAAAVLVPLLLIGIAVLMFTGDVSCEFSDKAVTLDSVYWQELTVEYDAIWDVAFREDVEAGHRVNGFGSPRLLLGEFQNDEFGRYVRYSYNGCEACVVVRAKEGILVISGKDRQETWAIYQELRGKIIQES